MEGSGRRWASLVVTSVTALTLVGCVDSGLPDRNLPLEEAEHREFRYEVYQPRTAAESLLHHEDSDWAVAGGPEHIPASQLVSAGMAGVQEVFALATDAAPIDRLYLETVRGWIPFVKVPANVPTGAGSSAAPH